MNVLILLGLGIAALELLTKKDDTEKGKKHEQNIDNSNSDGNNSCNGNCKQSSTASTTGGNSVTNNRNEKGQFIKKETKK